MRTLKISFILIVTLFLFITFAPQRNEANRKVLQKIKKIAALSILLKPKKLLGKRSGRLLRPRDEILFHLIH